MLPIPLILVTPPTHDDELTNEPDDYETTYQSPSSLDDNSYCTATECASPQQEYQSERVPEICVPSLAQTITSDCYKPGNLVVDQEISLRGMQSALSEFRHSLQNLTIGPAPVNRCAGPCATEKIDLSHLTSLKVDRVESSVLKELVSSVKMDNLRALDLRVDEFQGVMPHELNIEWSQLTDVTLRCDFSLRDLHKMMRSFRDVTRFTWSGKLVGSRHIESPAFELGSLKTVSIRSDKDGCDLFVQLLQKLQKSTLRTLHLSHFSPSVRQSGRGLVDVAKLSISSGITMDQFWNILSHLPSLEVADFAMSDHDVAIMEEHGWTASNPFAQLTSLTLCDVAAPIWI